MGIENQSSKLREAQIQSCFGCSVKFHYLNNVDESSMYKWGDWAKNLKIKERNFLIY